MAALKGKITDLRHTAGQHKACQSLTVPKCARPKHRKITVHIKVGCGQRQAVFKRTLSDVSKSVFQLDLSNTGIIKCIIPDSLQLFAYRQLLYIVICCKNTLFLVAAGHLAAGRIHPFSVNRADILMADVCDRSILDGQIICVRAYPLKVWSMPVAGLFPRGICRVIV